ncbi:helix-turn-helix domain-containing protein [Chryseolinea sp. T2]|uniref:helix-turn-helix domain-containing protein n=1 Tax=Chryseolinea sp. T2 TaxID=3129255 RepID=UPI003077E1FC
MFSFTNNQIKYTLEIPSYPANLFVDHYVYMEGESLRQGERLFPNNKTEMFFNLGGKVGGKGPIDKAPDMVRTMISGVRRSWFDFFPPINFRMIGLRFTLFGFYQLFKIPANQFTDNNFPAEDVWGAEIRIILERLHEANSCDEMFIILDDWIVKRVAGCSLSEMIVWQKMERMLSSPDVSVSELMDSHMGYSHKHSIQLFKDQSGLGPKDIQKIIRFDNALKGISHRPIQNWSAFAMSAGYADQSHLIRDFKGFTGYTPGEYLQIKPHEYHFYEVMAEEV